MINKLNLNDCNHRIYKIELTLGLLKDSNHYKAIIEQIEGKNTQLQKLNYELEEGLKKSDSKCRCTEYLKTIEVL